MKKGLIVYAFYLDTCSIGKFNMYIEEWHVTSIDKEFVYLNQKVEGVTWGKLSSKHGDFGFLPNIHKVFKDKVSIENFDKKYFKTKKSALLSNKHLVQKSINKLNTILKKIEKAKNL